jgi:hypothetical protein
MTSPKGVNRGQKDKSLAGHPTLFPMPLEIRFCNPANLGSVDCGQVCRADDGCDYVVKDGETGGSVQATPHSEWFCTQLATAIGIASAPCAILNMLDGTTAFGSRWEGGVLNPSIAGHWWEKVKSGEIPLDDIRGTLSRIYAFDNFVFNPDRHCGNFIVREQRDGFAVLAMTIHALGYVMESRCHRFRWSGARQ